VVEIQLVSRPNSTIMKFLINILFFVSILFLQSCVKSECNFGAAYNFEIPVTTTPTEEIYSIGDTITVTSSFSDNVYERKTNREYSLIDFKFYPIMGITEISDSIANDAALSDFEVLVDTDYDFQPFYYSSGRIDYVGQYNYQNNTYNLTYKIAPKTIGLFCLFYGHELITLEEDQEFEGKCPRKSSDVVSVMNGRVNTNIHFLHESSDPHFNTWIPQKPDQRFHKHGGYCFRVVE